MGNCLASQEKVIKVMKMDGKVLEYQEPLRVHQVLSEFPGHAISDAALPVLRHLHPNTQMLSGHLYYLLAPSLPISSGSAGDHSELPVAPKPMTTEPVGRGSSGVVRVKIVITKQKLEEMLRKGGLSVDEIVSHLQNGKSKDGGNGSDESISPRVWKPVLESIPEGNDVNH